MKRLLFVISQLYKGGAETALVNLLNHLDYTKYQVELLILNQEPVEGAVSLVKRINSNVKVCDAYQEFQKITIVDRIRAKMLYTMQQKGAYYFPALDFVRNKIYDWAFFIGEWYSPSFVAYEVQAKIKAAWIHNDLSEAEYFNAEHYFYFYDMFDYFIFVSENSKRCSIEAYPFLEDKAVCIYNINDIAYIREKAREQVEIFSDYKKPVLLTCANFRAQKNHLRQVRVMAELKKRGMDFIWMNIGATTDINLVNKVKALCAKENLEKDFLILGPKENPYAYIKRANAVTVLSDYESWSMVITEAKIIGTPVIATKTSGASEQIEDGVTGILTEFDVKDIADKIEDYLKKEQLRNDIRANLLDFDNTKEIIESFDELIKNGSNYKKRPVKDKNENRILYIIDDINYMGGAHVATSLQIREFLKQGKNISIYATNVPTIKMRKNLLGVRFLSYKDFREDILFNKRTLECLTNKTVNENEKRLKRKWLIDLKINHNRDFYKEQIHPYHSRVFSEYDIVCVMSEGSAFKREVALSKCKKKIQWIHIDYCVWRNMNSWNREVTKDDAEIYEKFDQIVVLTDGIKASFCDLYPKLKDKVIVNKNLIPVEEIKEKSKQAKCRNQNPVNFVTVGRIDYQKAYPRLIRVLRKLRENGYNFRWEIIGKGDEYAQVKNEIISSGLQDWVVMDGALDNPFKRVVQADVFALLSDFEGIPNTIYEALILGKPVIATDVGGVDTQIENGINGWLVENTEKAIYKKLAYIMENPNEVERIQKNNENYQYDNKSVMQCTEKIFSL